MKRYLQVYQYYKELISNEQLEAGTKLPSIRKGTQQFQVSRTTMENAYLLLAAEGYIISKPQSGYYVTDIARQQKERTVLLDAVASRERMSVRFDFVSSSVDRASFRFEVWTRYMKSALRQEERLLNYGEPQGEQDFREVLCEYLRKERSVVCTPRQIVIGAGVQSLLHILCSLATDKRKVAFYNPDFAQGRAIFEDYGYEITMNYDEVGTGWYYISPSQLTKWGGVMSVQERSQLVAEAGEKEFIIIEDDYNSEFQYIQKSVPSLQGMAGGRGVVYLGTFSKLLLPSIRMSYMVLPPELLERYELRRERYNQTASKAEQIAISQFIRDGHLARQVRKSRKIHMAKAQRLEQILRKELPKSVEIEIDDSGFYVYLCLKVACEPQEIEAKARRLGIALLAQPQERGMVTIMLNCANVAVENYPAAATMLKKCLQDVME